MQLKKMCNLDKENIYSALGNKEFCFWQAKPRMLCFISDVGTRGIYLSLTLAGVYNIYIYILPNKGNNKGGGKNQGISKRGRKDNDKTKLKIMEKKKMYFLVS